MIWGCITWYGVGTLYKVDGKINAVKYRDILDNHLWPLLARHFADKLSFPRWQCPCPSGPHNWRIETRQWHSWHDMASSVFGLKYYWKCVVSHQEIATKCSRKHKYSSRSVYCHSGYLDELYCGLHSELIYLYSTQDSGSHTVEGLPHKILR